MPYPILYEDNDVQVRFDAADEDEFVRFSDPDDGDIVRASKDAARDIADKLYEATGGSPVGAVRASAVTFNEALFRVAAVHGKTVTFRYAKGDGSTIETRTLVPQDVRKVGDHLTFTGFDPDRDEPRAYRLDRVKGEVTVR